MSVTEIDQEAAVRGQLRHFGRSALQRPGRIGARLRRFLTLPVLVGSAVICFLGFAVERAPWYVRDQILLGAVLAFVIVPLLARIGSALLNLLLEADRKRQLAERVEDLSRTRSGAVDAHGSDLRRIERDLHDGTQAQLVSLAMRLGLAERALVKDPSAAQALLGQAREGAEQAMTELRAVLRTMYPPILADRGLDGALSAVAARSTVPVRLEVRLPDAPPLSAPAETAVYFVVVEALTNVTKHSAAKSATVTVRREGERLHAEVRDEGRGGVDESAGSGIRGMRQRVEAVDGTLYVNSPPGGPTCVRADIPCGS
jgi:signal transduction histidine kinase